MNIHSFDSYTILRINKRNYTIQKLNFKQTMEFLIAYNAYVNMLTAHELYSNMFNWFEKRRSLKAIKAKENELMEYIGIPKYRQKDFKQIIKYISEKIEINKTKNPETEQEKKDRVKSYDKNYIQNIIAYFALNFGWSKKEIFAMYPKEIDIIISKANIWLDLEAGRYALAQLAPDNFKNELEAKQELDNKGSEVVETELQKRIQDDTNREKTRQAEALKGLKYGR